MEITEAFAAALYDYLSRRPFAEVEAMMAELRRIADAYNEKRKTKAPKEQGEKAE